MQSILRHAARVAVLAAIGHAPLAAQTLAITGARIHPVSGPAIPSGTIVIRNGKIVVVGASVSIPSDARRVDAAGKWVTPGIFNATTSLGVTEIGAVASTNDGTARGVDGVAAAFRVWEGYNPASPLLQVTRNDGMTTVGIVPGGGLIAGQAAVVSLQPGTLSDVILRAPAAMVADLSARGDRIGTARAEVWQRLRDVLSDARDFPRRRADFERAASRPLAARASDLQALQAVLRGEIPLMLDAERASDIEAALQLAREYRFRPAIRGASEGWKVAPALAAANAIVLVGALNNIPQSFDQLGARQDNAALLAQAGVSVVVAGGVDAFNARNVRYEAGVAVAFGMPWEAALRAVTLAPAQLFGVAARVGSLEPGKDATLVVWSGDPFEPLTNAERVFVDGVEVQGTSRQDELMRRYRTLPPDYRRRP